MDKKCINKLIEENMGLAGFCARKFIRSKIEFDDIYQVACLGLTKAANFFDKERNVKFSTYAVTVILCEIKQFFRYNNQISASRSLKDLLIKINKEREIFVKTNFYEPTVGDLSRILGEKSEKIIDALNFQKPVVSLDLNFDDGSFKGFVLESNENAINNILVSEALKNLDEKDRILLNLRFFHRMTQNEVAKNLGMSQVQVSRREKIIFKNLRSRLA